MTIDQLKGLCDRLKVEREALAKRQQMFSACRLSGHQHEVTVSISGVGSLQLSSISRESGYASIVIRGREIILLGVKKAIAAEVDKQAELVCKLEQQIADAVVTQ